MLLNPPWYFMATNIACLNSVYFTWYRVGRANTNPHVDAVGYILILLNSKVGFTGKPNGGGIAAPLKKIKISCNDISSSLLASRYHIRNYLPVSYFAQLNFYLLLHLVASKTACMLPPQHPCLTLRT